jgi:phosphopantetheinyl transferase
MLVRAVDPLFCKQLSDTYLSSCEQRYLSACNHPSRISDYVTSRLAAKLLVWRWLQLSPVAANELALYGLPARPPKLYLHQGILNELHVSVSHSKGLVLVGITDSQPFGVDIEHISGHDWTAIFAFMRWPLPIPPHHWQMDQYCCCVWAIYEAGFKLFGGAVVQTDFRLLSIDIPADCTVISGLTYSFTASFSTLSFAGEGLVCSDWVIAVAMEPLRSTDDSLFDGITNADVSCATVHPHELSISPKPKRSMPSESLMH